MRSKSKQLREIHLFYHESFDRLFERKRERERERERKRKREREMHMVGKNMTNSFCSTLNINCTYYVIGNNKLGISSFSFLTCGR